MAWFPQSPPLADSDFDINTFAQRHPTVVAAITDYFQDGRTPDDLFRDTIKVILNWP